MTLATKTWRRVSVHRVVLAWLRAERHTGVAKVLAQLPPPLCTPGLSKLLDQPRLDDAEENRARLRLLYMMRNVFVVEIPPDTEWYEVHSLTDDDLDELHVVNYQRWNDPADRNELRKVAARKRLPLQVLPANWEAPILLGHDRGGPFAIIEGNNRLTAYAGNRQLGLDIPVLIGLSPLRCFWNILDNCTFLMQDLILK
jgi:hypothetical protein